MSIAESVERFLAQHEVPYELVPHPAAFDATETAQAAHVPGDALAKSVVLHDERTGDYLLAVLPATARVHLGVLEAATHREVELASEGEVLKLFPDCDAGAVPPIGEAYGLETIVDDTIAARDDVYFEAGDHVDLVHVKGEDFRRILGDADLVHFARHT